MASFVRIHSCKFLHPCSLRTNKCNQMFSSNPFLSMSNYANKIPRQLVSASITPSSHHQGIVSPHQAEAEDEDADFLGKIDSWMQVSVTDIVKNLKQAPLLVQIFYSENDDGRIKIQTEKAIGEQWPVVKGEWRSGEAKSPDGLIFVEELEQEIMNQDFGEGGGGGGGVTRAWGIVVQGKGAQCGPACYLLKTNRVCSGLGLGFCTHFCLMRVNNFRDTALDQFKDSWLLQ